MKYRFKTVYLEDYEISDQITLMANAELIAGIHGAGLTNLIYADEKKVQVIEILPKNFLPTHYYWLCNSLSINYKTFYGGDLTADNSFEVDEDRLDTILSRYD